MSEAEPEGGSESNWQAYQKAQVALQLATAIERIAVMARDYGFDGVGVMLDMARDLARSEHVAGEALRKDG